MDSIPQKHQRRLPPYPGDVAIPDGVITRRCTRCEKTFPATLDYFQSAKGAKASSTGLQSQCKWCRSHDASRKPPLPEKPLITATKQCNKCGKELPGSKQFFFGDIRYPDGLAVRCKTCIKVYRQPKPITKLRDGYKICTVCREEFPATMEFFNTDKRNKDGIRGQCKECERKAHRKPPKDKSKKKCPGCGEEYPWTHEFFNYQVAEKGKLQCYCRECSHKIFNGYYEANKEEKRDEWNARLRRNRAASYDSYYARERAYTLANREHINEVVRNNPNTLPRIKAHQHKRRAIKLQVGGSYTADDIFQQFKRQKGKCYWCKCKFERENERYVYHIDHYTPLTREGTSNAAWNIVLACPFCNISRNNRLPQEWRPDRLF